MKAIGGMQNWQLEAYMKIEIQSHKLMRIQLLNELSGIMLN